MKSSVYSKVTQVFLYAALVSSLTGCGYHLRTSNDWPTTLRRVNIQADTIPAEARFNMVALLKAMHVQDTPDAQYALVFKHYHFQQSIPSAITNNLPIQITATASIQYQILNQDGSTCIAPVTLSSSFEQTEPTNSLIVNTVDPDIQQRLLQNLSDALYQRITSDNTEQQLTSSTCAPGKQKDTLNAN